MAAEGGRNLGNRMGEETGQVKRWWDFQTSLSRLQKEWVFTTRVATANATLLEWLVKHANGFHRYGTPTATLESKGLSGVQRLEYTDGWDPIWTPLETRGHPK